MPNIALVHSHEQTIYDEIARHTPDGFETVGIDVRGPLDEQIALAASTEYLSLSGTQLPDEVLKASGPRLLQILSAGWDFLNFSLIRELEVPVANNGGANSWAVADHTLLLLLAVYHRLIEADAATRSGDWGGPLNGMNAFELAGKTVGVLGIGSIGRQVAKRLHAFDAKVQYHDVQRLTREQEQALGLTYVGIEEMFETSDAVTVHVPLVPQTHHLVGRKLLASMKTTAVIVNTSRGALIDEAALIAALANNRIAGAGLDVFEVEPVEPDNPLLKMSQVIVTPHSAGNNWDAWSRRAAFGYANIARVQRGEAPLGLISF
jgi:lactate dehydrogenase-like 2-hydroxyacid dehydrogenase